MSLSSRPEALLASMAGQGCGPGALSALDASAKTMVPTMKSLAQANLELTQFWARRIRASLEVPQMLARCRTPQQCAHETIRIAREAAEDTRRTGEAVMRWWTLAVQQPSPLMAGWLSASQSLVPRPPAATDPAPAPRAVQRDVITFPERSARRN